MSKKLNEYAAFVLALRDYFWSEAPGDDAIGRRDVDQRTIECADKLRRLAIALQRHNERECSESWYTSANPAEERTLADIAADRLAKRLQAMKLEYGLKLSTSGDPRGYALRVMGLGVWNTWGGEEGGYGVPEE